MTHLEVKRKQRRKETAEDSPYISYRNGRDR